METKTSRFEKDPYNSYQNFLYNRALFGLSIYSQDEISKMSIEKKKRINKSYKKCQVVVNLLKQEVTNQMANDFFVRIFPGMEITNSLVNYFGTEGHPDHVNNMSFKMLKMNKTLIITRLIEKKVLPKNFNQLIPTESCK
jgi:hypothetical protein